MNLITCETSGQIQQFEKMSQGHQLSCVRCGSMIQREQPDSRTYTAALALAALFLYIPANQYPIMVMDYLGRHTENTVYLRFFPSIWHAAKTYSRGENHRHR
jgi:paraquat-inducible protein A